MSSLTPAFSSSCAESWRCVVLASERAGGYQAVSRGVQNVLSSLLLGLSAWLLLRNELHGGGGMMIVASVLGGRMLAPLVQMVTWRFSLAPCCPPGSLPDPHALLAQHADMVVRGLSLHTPAAP